MTFLFRLTAVFTMPALSPLQLFLGFVNSFFTPSIIPVDRPQRHSCEEAANNSGCNKQSGFV